MRERAPGKLSRRRILVGATAILVLCAAGAAAVRSRGYRIAPGRRLVSVSASQFVILEHLSRRVVAPDRTGTPAIPSADDLDVAGFADAWLARMDPRVRRDLGRFLAYVEHIAPIALGLGSRFTRLAPAEQDRVLASLEASPSDLLRAGFDGVRSLVFMGYYRDARTWAILGYDGPLVGRPAEGWR